MRTLVFVMVLIFLPAMGWTLESISDAELDKIMGKAGITVDFVSGTTDIVISLGKIAWGVDNGTAGTTAGNLRIESFTAGVGPDSIDLDIGISAGTAFTVDIDATNGIVMDLPASIDMNLGFPEGFLVSLTSGATTTYGALIDAEIITFLSLDAYIEIVPPTVLFIQPH